jgi:hypothetical protein
MSEPTASQLRKVRELLAKADSLLGDMLETLTASSPARAARTVALIAPPLNLPDNVDLTAWQAYQAHRRAIKAKKLSPRGLDLLAAEFAKYPPAAQLACVDMSIKNGWIGIFFDKVRYTATDRVEVMKERLQQWIANSSQS